MSRSSDDPRKAGGGMFDAGTPMDRGKVMFDTRNAVLVEAIEVAVAHTTRKGQPAPDAVALTIEGRINRPPDDAISAKSPKEFVTHLHMISWEGAADLVVEIQALAARDGFALRPLLEEKWNALAAKGLTQRAPDGDPA